LSFAQDFFQWIFYSNNLSTYNWMAIRNMVAFMMLLVLLGMGIIIGGLDSHSVVAVTLASLASTKAIAPAAASVIRADVY
jgi:hypothetical protein